MIKLLIFGLISLASGSCSAEDRGSGYQEAIQKPHGSASLSVTWEKIASTSSRVVTPLIVDGGELYVARGARAFPLALQGGREENGVRLSQAVRGADDNGVRFHAAGPSVSNAYAAYQVDTRRMAWSSGSYQVDLHLSFVALNDRGERIEVRLGGPKPNSWSLFGSPMAAFTATDPTSDAAGLWVLGGAGTDSVSVREVPLEAAEIALLQSPSPTRLHVFFGNVGDASVQAYGSDGVLSRVAVVDPLQDVRGGVFDSPEQFAVMTKQTGCDLHLFSQGSHVVVQNIAMDCPVGFVAAAEDAWVAATLESSGAMLLHRLRFTSDGPRYDVFALSIADVVSDTAWTVPNRDGGFQVVATGHDGLYVAEPHLPD